MRRRVNTRYLVQVVERLGTLGIALEDLPEEILEARWEEQRRYFEDVLLLHYCVRCKLPIADVDASPGNSLCTMHYERLQERFTLPNLVRLRSHRGTFLPDRAPMPDNIQRAYHKKLGHVVPPLAASNPEAPTFDAVHDIDTILAKARPVKP